MMSQLNYHVRIPWRGGWPQRPEPSPTPRGIVAVIRRQKVRGSVGTMRHVPSQGSPVVVNVERLIVRRQRIGVFVLRCGRRHKVDGKRLCRNRQRSGQH